MRQRTTLIIALIILIACGLAGGLAAQASFNGSSGPGPAQSAQFTPNPDAGGAPVISYQGVLQEGVNPYQGSADMTFIIYQGGTPGGGGISVWQEYQPGITISETGYFSTLIGTGSPISQALFSQTGDPMYLEVQVDSEIMSPRQRLAGVPYAFHAYYSGTAIYAALAGTASHANYADNAGDAEMLDGQYANEFLDKATYDCDTDNVVDHAELADVAIYANDADKLDNHDLPDFMLEAEYDSTPGDGVVDHAAMADATAAWSPEMTAGGAITIGDVVGIDEEGKLVTGCGSFGLPAIFNPDNKISNIDIDAFSPTKVAIAYFDEVGGGTPQGKAVICSLSGDGATWTCGEPVAFKKAATSYIDVACYTIDSTDYVVVNFIYAFKGCAWAQKVTGTTIDPGTNTFAYKEYTAASDATMDKIPGYNRFLITYNNGSGPKAVIGNVIASGGGYPGAFTWSTHFPSPSAVYMNKATVAVMSPTRFVVSGVNTTSDNGVTFVGKMTMSPLQITYYKVSSYYYSGNVKLADIETWGNEKVIASFVNEDYYNTDYSMFGCYNQGQLNGTDPVNISFGTVKPFIMGGIDYPAMDMREIGSGGRAAIAYMDIPDKGKGKVSLIDISDSGDITVSDEKMFCDAPPKEIDIVWLDDDTYAIAYADVLNNSIGNVVMGRGTWIEPVGIAKQDGTTGNPINVAVGGVVDNLVGLTPGAIYYGTVGGDLTTQDTGCKIGRAVSTTEIALSIDAEY